MPTRNMNAVATPAFVAESRGVSNQECGATPPMKFLVPVDGSANADRALTFAMRLARAVAGSEVVVLNVREHLERSYVHGLNSEAAREHLQTLGREATAGARRMLDESGCLYQFEIVFGKAAEVIARVAAEQSCDCVVMGTRGLSDVESVFLGSTSHNVVQLSTVPVTLVK